MSRGSQRSTMPLLAVSLLAAHLTACDREPVSFPSHPPLRRSRSADLTSAVPLDHATLRRLAGPGARDCGMATEPEAATRVYRCGSDAFAKRQPFFCRFGAPDEIAPLGPTPEGLVWGIPVAFVGKGSSIAIAERRGNLEPILTDQLRMQPLHVTSGMTRPIPTAGPLPIAFENDIHGIIIVRAVVGRDGRTRGASLMKPIGSEAMNRAALHLVANSPFEPARLFGVPVDALVHIPLAADRAGVRFWPSSPAASRGAIVIEGVRLPRSDPEAPPAPGDEVERPFPATVLEPAPGIRSPILISRGERRAAPGEGKCRGLVQLRMVIDQAGRVVATADLSSNPDAFTRSYADAAYESTFRPATREGVPVAVHFLAAVHVKCA